MTSHGPGPRCPWCGEPAALGAEFCCPEHERLWEEEAYRAADDIATNPAKYYRRAAQARERSRLSKCP